MDPSEQRKFERFSVQFRTSFSSGKMLAGNGTITDLSARGCRVAYGTLVPTGTQLEMRIDLLDEKAPIEIDSAVVRWSNEQEFGLEFVLIEPQSFDHLSSFINSLKQASDPDQQT